MNPLTPAARAAIVKSIAHWRDIKAKLLPKDNKTQALERLWLDGELSDKKCELCQYALTQYVLTMKVDLNNGHLPCVHCPLAVSGNGCFECDSLYRKVARSAIGKRDDTAVMTAVNAMLMALESLLPPEERP